ncbi:MAG: RNA polymerase sigma factor [Ilumatobacteraceae bacterium]|nr:RNA polymerase sigma factor [Ilumatobacteraceae bacterium]
MFLATARHYIGYIRNIDRDDKSLVAAAHKNDVGALNILLHRHYNTIRAVCHRIVIDHGGADDATQNALIAIAKGIHAFDNRSSITTWMYRIAVNASLDEVRRTRRRPLPMDPADQKMDGISVTMDDMGNIDDQILISDALQQVDSDFRIPVVLRHVADMDYDEIARTLDIPVGTVKSRIARGRRQLAQMMMTTAEGST